MSAAAGPDELRRLLDAVLSVGSDLDLAATLERIVDAAVTVSGATYGALGVLNSERSGLSEFVTVGLTPEQREAIGELPTGRGLLGRLISDPRPLRVPDIEHHESSTGFPPGHPRMRSFLGVPILVGGTAFGNLYLCDKAGGEVFTELDEELVVMLARAAAIAIENARLHARVAELVLVEDRERIARDLHDTVIQRLFAVGLSLQAALRLSTDASLTARLESAVDELDLTVREVRSAIFELHLPRLPGPSVRRAALEIAAESARALGFDPEVRFSGPVDASVDETLASHVLAVLREALANVAKHAGATKVTVNVVVESGMLSVEVVDNGCGPPSVATFGGRGLENMGSRAQALGGSFTFERAPNGGTAVRWIVPVS